MALFNSGNDEQKQRVKQAEKVLDELVGGMMPTSARRTFFKRMDEKAIKARNQEKVRSKVLKTIKDEVKNNELEPTRQAIDQRIEQILNESCDLDLVEKRRRNHMAATQKAQAKKGELERKFGIDLTNRQWFKCSIEEIKYSTFSNQPIRNIDNAYVIVNEDNFEIIKESVWLKSNMGSRRIFFYNIASIDYDARGRLHASSSVILNTKSAEHVQLKFVTKENFDLMNNAYESYLKKMHEPQQAAPVQQNIQTVSAADELLKYAELYEKGLLTKEEFDLKKEQLLNGGEIGNGRPEPEVVEIKPKYCGNCGASIDGDSNFCSACGKSVK